MVAVQSILDVVQHNTLALMFLVGATCFVAATLALIFRPEKSTGLLVALVLSFIMATPSIIDRFVITLSSAGELHIEVKKLEAQVEEANQRLAVVTNQTHELIATSQDKTKALNDLVRVVKSIPTAQDSGQLKTQEGPVVLKNFEELRAQFGDVSEKHESL